MQGERHLQVSKYDAFIGMDVFTTQSPGIGGRLKQSPEDFLVQEIGVDGSIAPLEPTSQVFEDKPGKFTEFFLVKRNLDSIQAIRQLSKAIGASYKRFSYAGIKDRRAVTSQRVSFYRGAPQDLIGRDIPNIQILHPHRETKPITAGALIGNRFTITVREVDLTREEAHKRIEKIRQEYTKAGGILNFYGPQRFGIMRPTTHLIGKQIVCGNFEEAVRILLEGGDISSQEILDSSDVDKNAASNGQTQRMNRLYGSYERAIQHYLDKHPGQFKESLRVLPKDLVRLYVHAYQSFIFNKTLSERMKRGISLHLPNIGDFIMPISGEIHQIRPVTRENLSQAKKAVQKGVQKLVLPVIGFDFEDVALQGPTREIISAILDEEDITPSQFYMRELPILSSRGTFRPLLVNPTEFSVVLLDAEGDTPVRVSFNLAKGSYASVVLREFIKPEVPTQL
jgi:tRNA pseudouridine13 synthase